MSDHRRLTSAELMAEARQRFGDDHLAWAFQCPHCGDVANGHDFRDALANNPRTGSDGECVLASQLLGQECIGRTLGALTGPPTSDSGKARAKRGCDWAAYGLFGGPWEIVMADGRSVWAFPLADAPTPATAGAR